MVRNYKRKTKEIWTREDLLQALMSINNCKLKIADVARQYGISRSTLYRRYKKFFIAGCKYDVRQFSTSVGNQILTHNEEEVFENTIKNLREQGCPVTMREIKRICFEYCDSNGIPNRFNAETRMAGNDWYYGFLKRRPGVRFWLDGQSKAKLGCNRDFGEASDEQNKLQATDVSSPSPKIKIGPRSQCFLRKHLRAIYKSPTKWFTPGGSGSGRKRSSSRKKTLDLIKKSD